MVQDAFIPGRNFPVTARGPIFRPVSPLFPRIPSGTKKGRSGSPDLSLPKKTASAKFNALQIERAVV